MMFKGCRNLTKNGEHLLTNHIVSLPIAFTDIYYNKAQFINE